MLDPGPMPGPSRPALPLPVVQPLSPPPDLEARLGEMGVKLPPRAAEQLGAYLALLLAMNEQMNLTAITEPAEAWSRHVLDALSLVPHVASAPAGARLLDVGSGGGVPGVPIAIARPDLRVTLLDATEKKVGFLRAATEALGLENVDAVCGRAETLARGELAGAFDVVTARAVGKVSTLLSWTAPFAKPGGLLLLIKGERAETELAEARRELAKHRCRHEKTVVTPTGRVVVLRK